MMKEECRLNIGLFGDKKLYLMQDNNGITVIKSRGVGRDAGGNDILSYRDFLKLFMGEVLNIRKQKFIIKNDGIYIIPQSVTVRLGENRLLKIKEEIAAIIDNIKHPLYILAREIEAINFTALMIPRSQSFSFKSRYLRLHPSMSSSGIIPENDRCSHIIYLLCGKRRNIFRQPILKAPSGCRSSFIYCLCTSRLRG